MTAHSITFRSLLFRFLLTALLLVSPACFGQARYAAEGPGSYIAVGATVSAFDSDYGKRLLGGETAYVDANLYRRVGIEAEARRLNLHSDDGIKQTTYLIGPKFSVSGRSVRFFGKFLAGRGEMEFPFGDAHGSYFVLAPGAGLDLRIRHSRLNFRVVDLEYQIWPQFSFGPLHPIGISTGFSYNLPLGQWRYR